MIKSGGRPSLGAAVILATILCYYNSCFCGFVFDDISAVRDNKDLRPHTPLKNVFFNDFWGTPMHKEQSHKSYRPLCVLTFRWNYLLHGLQPAGYHLVNVVLHAVAGLMYYRICCLLLPEVASFVAAMLFAVHPIHTEAVTGVVGRAETLSSVFFLSAFLFYTRAAKNKRSTGWKSLALSVASVAAAMLCKEQGITITGICVVYEIFVVQKMRLNELPGLARALFGISTSSATSGGVKSSPSRASNALPWSTEASRRLGVLTASTAVLLLARLQVMGSQLPVFTKFDNPASVAEWPTRHMTYSYLCALNLRLLLWPCDLCCDWTMGTVPLLEELTDTRNLATLGAAFLFGALAITALTAESKRKRTALTMGLAFMALPFLPASNLFFPVGFVVAERVLYMPSMGFCMLVGYGWYLLPRRKLAWWLLAATLTAHAVRTHRRNWDWESEYSIFMAGLKVNQNNAKLFNNVGHALESQGRYVEALHYFHTAVRVQPDDVGAHINVGRTYNHLKRYTEAEEAYLRAKELLPKAKPGESYQARIPPNHLSVFLNLANLIAKNTTRLEEADLLYRQAISMRADYTQAYINRGDVLIRLNRTLEAQEVYERALLYDSSNPDIYYNLGVVFLEQGKAPQALAYLDKALEFDPDHEQALLNSAILLQELGKKEFRPIARERLLKLHAKDENNERVHFNLGMLSMDERNIADAENWFRRAVHIKSDFRSALFNLALLLADDHRPLEAAPFLNQLVRHHPDHAKGLILLGDIYINNIRDLDAAENCYKRILQLDPVNIQGLHNLCVVYVERGKLMQAQSCLKHAHQMAPKEDYILRHLQIVQNKIAKLRTTPEKIENMEAFMEVDVREFGGDKLFSIKSEKNMKATPTTKILKTTTVHDPKPTRSKSTQNHKPNNSKGRIGKDNKNYKSVNDQQKLKRTDRPRPEPEPMFVDSLDGTVVDTTSLRHNTEYRSSNSVHSGITRSAAYSLNPQRSAASDIEEQTAGLS